ncbi:hypothetical protein ABT095_34740, partial [Kitasatospora sp. NPDC002227]
MLELVFPHLVTVLVERVVVKSGVLRIAASTKDGTAAVCPECGTLSMRVHSRYGCPASSSWQVFGFGKVGDERVRGAGVDVVWPVP